MASGLSSAGACSEGQVLARRARLWPEFRGGTREGNQLNPKSRVTGKGGNSCAVPFHPPISLFLAQPGRARAVHDGSLRLWQRRQRLAQLARRRRLLQDHLWRERPRVPACADELHHPLPHACREHSTWVADSLQRVHNRCLRCECLRNAGGRQAPAGLGFRRPHRACPTQERRTRAASAGRRGPSPGASASRPAVGAQPEGRCVTVPKRPIG